MADDERQTEGKIRQCLTTWLNNTTIHGFSRAKVSEKYIGKAMWILMMVIGLACALYLVKDVTQNFFQGETKTSQKFMRESPTDFPSVTFCNLNVFYEPELNNVINKYNLSQNSSCLKNIFTDHVDKNACLEEFGKITNGELLERIEKTLKRVIANNLAKIKLNDLKQIGFDYSDMVISCEFNGEHCDLEFFTKTWTTNNGLCYTFNGKKTHTRKTTKIGQSFGLHMVLQTKPTETKYTKRNGIYLVVHNQTDSLDGILNHGINLPAGFETYIGVSRVTYKKIPIDFLETFFSFKCIKNMDELRKQNPYLADQFKTFGETEYDKKLCLDLCFQDNLYKSCDCYDIATTFNKSVRYCETKDELNCAAEFSKTFLNSDKTCNNICIDECEQQNFLLTNSQSAYPSYESIDDITLLGTAKNLRGSEKIQFTRDNILKFIVNYNDLAYTVIKEEQDTPLPLFLVNIGGGLSLCLGLSIFNFFEIFFVFLEICILVPFLVLVLGRGPFPYRANRHNNPNNEEPVAENFALQELRNNNNVE